MYTSEKFLPDTGIQSGYWEWDMKGGLPFNDQGLMQKLGYHRSELLMQPLAQDKIPAHDQHLIHQQLNLHIDSHGQIPFEVEIAFLHAGAATHYYLFAGKVVQWQAGGKPALMMGTYLNISKQKELSFELNHLRGFLNKTNQAARIGSWEIDLETYKVNWTDITREIFGVGADFTPEKENFIHFFKEGKDREKLKAAFKDAVTTGKPYDLELRLVNARGEKMWTRTIGQPEFEDGKCKRVYGIFQDVTRQKHDAEQLRMKQAQLEAFISAAPAALAMLDRDFNYVAASKVWMRSYNIDVATIIGRNHLEVFHEISDEWKGFMKRCLYGESFKNEEDPFVRRDGKTEYLRWEIKPWYEEPNKVGGVILFTDLITEKIEARQELIKAKEDAIGALQAKSRFLSVMSHEIRTPMNAVVGFSNLLLENAREDQQESLKLLKFSADNLMVIINDILNLSKIEEGMINFEQVDISLKELLENIYAINKPITDQKNIGLKLNYDASLPVFIKGDAVRLGQVITNLVNNAIKFTQSGEVSIHAMQLEHDEESVNICFEVKDTGIGIPPEKIDYIFEIFTQASSETTRRFGGIGLGLAICKRLVDLMGGDIVVKSKVDVGSVFSFCLVFKKGDEKLKAAADIPTDDYKTSAALHGVKLLLAEDNPINVLVVKRYLQQWGVQCDVAVNGQAALDMIADTADYEMILMDLQMPVMDGFEASRQIRLLSDDKAAIPIVAITASLVGDILDAVVESGMNDFISKPFNPAELFGKIKKYTRAHHS